MKYLVLGAGPGSMGEAIAYRLLLEKNSQVYIADQNRQNLAHTAVKLRQLCRRQNSELVQFERGERMLDIVGDRILLPHIFEKFDVVVSAVPASLNPIIAEAVVLSNRYRQKDTPPRTCFADLGGVLEYSRKILTGRLSEQAK